MLVLVLAAPAVLATLEADTLPPPPPALLKAVVKAVAAAVAFTPPTAEFGGIVKSLGPLVLSPVLPPTPTTPPPPITEPGNVVVVGPLLNGVSVVLPPPPPPDVAGIGTVGVATEVGVAEGVLFGLLLLLFKAAAAVASKVLLVFAADVGVTTLTRYAQLQQLQNNCQFKGEFEDHDVWNCWGFFVI